MWKNIHRLSSWASDYITLWQFLVGSTFGVGLLTAWLSTAVDFVTRYGSFGWLVAGLIGSALTSIILLAALQIRLTIIKSGLFREWGARATHINPFHTEFTKTRIIFGDLGRVVN